ncbi:fructose-bisphosphate aldolase, class I [Tanacetum coccineum]
MIDFTLLSLTEQAQTSQITDCHVGNPCEIVCDPRVIINSPMIRRSYGYDKKERIYLCEKVSIVSEMYFAITLDRTTAGPITLNDHHVPLEGTLLKRKWLHPGSDFQDGSQVVVDYHCCALQRTMPPAVPAIVFLSGKDPDFEYIQGEIEIDVTMAGIRTYLRILNYPRGENIQLTIRIEDFVAEVTEVGGSELFTPEPTAEDVGTVVPNPSVSELSMPMRSKEPLSPLGDFTGKV